MFCATGLALRISTAKATVLTAGCELALYNGNCLGEMTSVSWRPATAAFCTQIGFATTESRFFPTEPTFGTGVTTVRGGLGRSARDRLQMGYIWREFWMTRAR